jgi:hypothetical protein
MSNNPSGMKELFSQFIDPNIIESDFSDSSLTGSQHPSPTGEELFDIFLRDEAFPEPDLSLTDEQLLSQPLSAFTSYGMPDFELATQLQLLGANPSASNLLRTPPDQMAFETPVHDPTMQLFSPLAQHDIQPSFLTVDNSKPATQRTPGPIQTSSSRPSTFVSIPEHSPVRIKAELSPQRERQSSEVSTIGELDMKKLSAKERRQIRNKLSARTFRQRRKEYLQDLEGRIKDVEEENAQLKSKVTKYRSENEELRQQLEAMRIHTEAMDEQRVQSLTTFNPNKDLPSQPNLTWGISNGRVYVQTAIIPEVNTVTSELEKRDTQGDLSKLMSQLSIRGQHNTSRLDPKLAEMSMALDATIDVFHLAAALVLDQEISAHRSVLGTGLRPKAGLLRRLFGCEKNRFAEFTTISRLAAAIQVIQNKFAH